MSDIRNITFSLIDDASCRISSERKRLETSASDKSFIAIGEAMVDTLTADFVRIRATLAGYATRSSDHPDEPVVAAERTFSDPTDRYC